MSGAFVLDGEAFQDLAVKDTALPASVGETIKVAIATYTKRFGARLRDRMSKSTGWQSAHSNHQSPARRGNRFAPNCMAKEDKDLVALMA